MEITRTESDLLSECRSCPPVFAFVEGNISVLPFMFIVDRDVPNELGADVVSVSKSMKKYRC